MIYATPHGIGAIIARYGALTDDFEAKNIVSFDLPYPLVYDGRKVHRTRCHRLAVDNFRMAFERIAAAGLTEYAINYGGIYNRRNSRGGTRPSTHSWGIAIDLEPQEYPLRSTKRFPQRVIEAFADAGFFYGGDFKRRLDPMHFQLATGY